MQKKTFYQKRLAALLDVQNFNRSLETDIFKIYTNILRQKRRKSKNKQKKKNEHDLFPTTENAILHMWMRLCVFDNEDQFEDFHGLLNEMKRKQCSFVFS